MLIPTLVRFLLTTCVGQTPYHLSSLILGQYIYWRIQVCMLALAQARTDIDGSLPSLAADFNLDVHMSHASETSTAV
ncbi:hypothetical protein B0H19DRAFT_242386 [Mycena capillaripes]|nr:hypothetical protein B0H19DRAFT_242386 [Mycena capillaripes]